MQKCKFLPTLQQTSLAALGLLLSCLLTAGVAFGQVDQGTIAGVVVDASGAVIADAQVTLANKDTGLVLEGKSDRRGNYIFSPIKIGNYKLSATSTGFQTTTQENVHVNIQDRLNIVIALKPGNVQETVTVDSGPPLLQADSGSVGQVVSAATINETPLNGRNYVYIAQLTAGVAPSVSGASRGGGSGDFFANGQRATQNNFILDGVDNNVNVDDFMNGASYNVKPPPDALAEFKIDTSNYSAEFGHSAGAVVNASIKSGTNQIHGDVWEYARNTFLDAQDWDATSVPDYHENQFGATLGLPLWRNRIFYFGDAEANRIAFANPFLGTVPTPLMRQGNFTELFNPALTGAASPQGIFAPNTGGQLPLTCGGPSVAPDDPHVTALNGERTTNILCPGDPSVGGQQDIVAGEIFKAYPNPNTAGWNSSNNTTGTGGLTYNNYRVNLPTHENTFQWDQRVDWNITEKDQTYARYSYTHAQVTDTPALGPVIDGGNDVSGFQGDNNFNLAENFMLSETHLFTPTLVNEFRFGYNWGNYQFLQANSTVPASTLIPGLGGVPFGPGQASEANGGLPYTYFQSAASISAAGARRDVPSIEKQNIYQILDNVTKSFGRHSLKFGLQFQTIRTSLSQPQYPRGRYRYSGTYTKLVGEGDTGSGMADAFTNNMASTAISPDWNVSYYRWYRSGYGQDDWRISSKLTLNLGVRYDYVQPISSKPGAVANFVQTGATGGIGTGTGVYQLSSSMRSKNIIPAAFQSLLATQNVTLQYVDSKSLTTAQKLNFAPRVGFAYQVDPRSVVRGGYGIFFGGVEAPGAAELTVNYPFAFTSAVYNNSPCLPSINGGYMNAASLCQSTATPNTTSLPYLPYSTTLETGISAYINGPGGTAGLVSSPVLNTSDPHIHTPYTESYNLAVERSLSKNLVASLGYVGNVGRHLYSGVQANSPYALLNPNNPTYTNIAPFPGIGELNQSSYSGISAYNGLQAKMEKRFASSLSFLATYTWSHAMDDTTTPGGIESGINARNTNIIPLNMEFTNSAFDVRHRVTLNGYYELPFGSGKQFVNNHGVTDYVIGGWSTSLTWAAQTGNPITITPGGNFNSANGGNVNAVLLRDPFGAGGTPDPSNTNMAGQTCPARVHTKANWFNPCAFGEPLQGTLIPTDGDAQFVRGAAAAKAYLGGKSNQIYGPGYERVNMSLFKNLKTFREQYLQVRVDAFNLLNTPSLSVGDTSDGPTGGAIYTPQTFQNLTPDSRFFQLAAKYVF